MGVDSTPVKLVASPSLVINNLTGSGEFLYYCHAEKVVKVLLADSKSEVKTVTAQADTSSLIHQLRFCQLDEFAVLVLARSGSVQIWDGTGSRLVFAWSLPPLDTKPGAATMVNFACGIAIHAAADGSSQICVGSASGDVHVYGIGQGGRISHSTSLSEHHVPITALGSSLQSCAGRLSDSVTCLLVSGDSEGNLIVWEAHSASDYAVKHRIEGQGVPVVSLAVREESVFAALTDGALRIHNLADGKLQLELQAHSRYLSAMALHPSRNLIATAAEDCTINVWSLSPTHQVELLLSVCWNNAMVTGVAFCGADHCTVAACAYDTDELRTWQLPSGP